MFKQLIIARRDLNMSPGKLAAQVSHASIAFLLEKLYWGSIVDCLRGGEQSLSKVRVYSYNVEI